MLKVRPGNKGRRYPADPLRVEEIVAVMKAAGDGAFGCFRVPATRSGRNPLAGGVTNLGGARAD
jgi:hypothetical protein